MNSTDPQDLKTLDLVASSIYQTVAKKETGNFCLSPFSIELVLAQLQKNSKEEPEQEPFTLSEATLQNLLKRIKANRRLYIFHPVSKLFVAEKFSPKNTNNLDIESIDFGGEKAAKIINTWVDDNTVRKIKNLEGSSLVNGFNKAILISTVYFKADWFYPFSEPYTKRGLFYTSGTEAVKSDFMRLYKKICNYYRCEDLEAEFLELPFDGAEASMVIVLPNEKDGLSKIEKDIDKIFNVKFWRGVLDISLPKFEIETCADFKKVFKNLGVYKCFDEQQIDTSEELFINELIHKTYIRVNEVGVEAEEPTFVEILAPRSLHREKPINFIIDHPFLFYIKIKDVVVFIGRVIEPTYE